MSLASAIQNKASDLGRSSAFRIAVAAVFSLVIAVGSILVYREAARLDRIADALPQLLRNADFKAKDAVATQLVEKGTIDVDGVPVGSEALRSAMERMFEGTGKIERVAEAASILLGTARPQWMPASIAQEPIVALAAGGFALCVVGFACYSGLAVPLVVVTAVCALLWTPLAFGGRLSLGTSLAAIPFFMFVFTLVVRLLLVVLDRASPMFAVAAGVVREAIRLRIAIAFAAIAIFVIPLLPQWIDPTSPLRYQVQTYLARSLDTMYLVCAFLTVFLGCATVAFEIRDRQAWTTLTKPVSRLSWLAGKWLGLVALNAAILLTCTVAMYAFLVQIRSRPAEDLLDALAVEDEVLVARVGGLPAYTMLPPNELQSAVEEAIKADPNAQADIREGTRTEIEVKKTLARAIAEEYLKQQRSVGPNQERVYKFSGLGYARESKSNLSLRYKFYAGESDPNEAYPVVFVFGTGDAQTWIDRNFVPAQSNVVTVPASCVASDGSLELRIVNAAFNPRAKEGEPQFLPGRGTIAFDPDGIELLYRVGGFTDNLVRGQIVNLTKLSFLGMLSVVCASILSFPVAILVVFTVFSAGSIGPFLATSVSEYRIRTDSSALKAFEWIVRTIAGATEFSVRAFADAQANSPLVEGRLVSWFVVGRTLILIGFAWSGIVLALGFAAFRRKELAIYSGQGG